MKKYLLFSVVALLSILLYGQAYAKSPIFKYNTSNTFVYSTTQTALTELSPTNTGNAPVSYSISHDIFARSLTLTCGTAADAAGTYTNRTTPPATPGTFTASNYTITYNAGATITATKAPLAVTADHKTKPYNTTNPSLTVTITGLVFGVHTCI